MATGTYSPDPFYQFCDDNGDPLSGGLLYTYSAGTTTPLATYSNVSLTTANTNPVVLDSAGRCTLFLSPTSYKFVLKNSSGVTIATRDNVGSVPTTNIDNDVAGTAGEALSATQCVYLGAGTWSKADADVTTSSTKPVIAFVVADVDSGAAGTFRLSGRMSGFTGLTPGVDYYVSATAGQITSTAPSNARYVGRADSISSLIIAPNPPSGTLGVHDLWIPASAMVPNVSTPCGWHERLTATGGTYVGLPFDGTTAESSNFSIRMPKSWNEGTIAFTPYFYNTAGGSGNVFWAVYGQAVSNAESMAWTLVAGGSSTTSVQAASVLTIGAQSAALAVQGSPAAGDLVNFSVVRFPDIDTYTSDAYLLGVTLHITTDAPTDD